MVGVLRGKPAQFRMRVREIGAQACLQIGEPRAGGMTERRHRDLGSERGCTFVHAALA